MNKSKRLFLMAVFLTIFAKNCSAEIWKCTAYTGDIACCGKADNITASGKLGRYGYVACNWLKFGTRIKIAGMGIFLVEDRGAKSLFGSKHNHIKHLDIYLNSYAEAKRFGVKYRDVEILK